MSFVEDRLAMTAMGFLLLTVTLGKPRASEVAGPLDTHRLA